MPYPNVWDQYQPFKYIFCNMVTGEVLGMVPLQQVTFGKTLNGSGQFSGTIDLYDPNTQLMDVLFASQPALCAVFVDYNGALVAGYALLAAQGYDWSPNKAQLTITGVDLIAYFAQRIQATDYSSPPYSGITGPSTAMAIWNAAYASVGSAEVGWDPVLMAAQILSDALQVEPPYSNLLGGIAVAANGYPIQAANGTISTAAYLADASATNISNYVAQTFPFTSNQQISTIVNQLAGLGYEIGFDIGFDVAYSDGPISVPLGTINLSTPTRGRSYAQNNIVLDARSVLSYQWPVDPSQAANTVYENGPSGCISALQNINPLEQGYPLLERTISRSQVTSGNITQQLFNLGISDLFLYSYPVAVPQITISLFDPNVQLGQFIEGDQMLIRIPATDWSGTNVWDPRFPTGLDQEWRITGYSATVADDGESTIQFQLTQPPGLVALDPWL